MESTENAYMFRDVSNTCNIYVKTKKKLILKEITTLNEDILKRLDAKVWVPAVEEVKDENIDEYIVISNQSLYDFLMFLSDGREIKEVKEVTILRDRLKLSNNMAVICDKIEKKENKCLSEVYKKKFIF